MTEKEQRYFEILLEQVLHEVKTVAEGHDVLRNEIRTSYKELEEKINLNSSQMKFGFETLDAKIDSVGSRLDAKIDGVGSRLDAKFNSVQEELKKTREKLSTEIKAVGRKVEGHEDRIRFLERKVA